MTSKVYKWCAVPLCKNTSVVTPNKLFIYVPNKKTVREKWLKMARRDPSEVVTNSAIYFCEDHFNLPNDMENYMQYHLMGSVAQVRTVPGCVPTKFKCQPDRDGQTSDTAAERPYYLRTKRKKMALGKSCKSEKPSEESGVAEQILDSEETVSRSSGSPQAPPRRDEGGAGGRGRSSRRARRTRQYCVARGCPHTNTRCPHLSFFSLPRDALRRQQWLKAINREDLLNKEDIKCKSYVVCSAHFDESQIRVVKHIKAGAVPRGVRAEGSGGAEESGPGGRRDVGTQAECRRLARLQHTQVLQLDTGPPAPPRLSCTTHTHAPRPARAPSPRPRPRPDTNAINIIDVKIEKVEPDWDWDQQLQ